jgi:hypothetical protein
MALKIVCLYPFGFVPIEGLSQNLAMETPPKYNSNIFSAEITFSLESEQFLIKGTK